MLQARRLALRRESSYARTRGIRVRHQSSKQRRARSSRVPGAASRLRQRTPLRDSNRISSLLPSAAKTVQLTIVPASPPLVVPLEKLRVVQVADLPHDAGVAQPARAKLERVDSRESFQEDVAYRHSARIYEGEGDRGTSVLLSSEGAERRVQADGMNAGGVPHRRELLTDEGCECCDVRGYGIMRCVKSSVGRESVVEGDDGEERERAVFERVVYWREYAGGGVAEDGSGWC
mgnify:CR=1 FL=1